MGTIFTNKHERAKTKSAETKNYALIKDFIIQIKEPLSEFVLCRSKNSHYS